MDKEPKKKHSVVDIPSDPLGLTPFLGTRGFSDLDTIYTLNRDEAFLKGTTEYPEEAILFLNQKKLRTRAQLIKHHFIPPEEGGRVAYAVKANAHRNILRILTSEDITSFDCASPKEIALVQEANPRAEIFYNHPIKKEKDIREAIEKRVRHFTTQSKREIEKILKNASGVDPNNLEIAVRLDTPNPHAGINLSEKFGAHEREVREMIQAIKRSGARPGISIHTGSQNTDPQIFSDSIGKMCAIAREEGGVKTINIGGGLPANILESHHFSIEVFLEVITEKIRKEIEGVFSGDPTIIIEPGRAMVAECIDLLIPVLSVEERNGEKVLYMDDGIFTSFSDAVIHRWQYPFRTWRKNGKPFSSKNIPLRVFGRTCDSGDCLGIVELPEDLQEGDYLHLPTAGAYTDSQASQFNGFDPPRYLSYSI